MPDEEQLGWEARAGRPAATAAFLAVGSLMAATIVRQTVFADGGDNDREILTAIDKNADNYVLSTAIQGLSVLASIVILYYLFRAVRARNPELPNWILPLLVGGPILLCIAGVLTSLNEVDVADQFINTGRETAARADDLRKETDPLAVALSFGGTFATAISFVLISMNAMRVGLLSRFMGILGIIIGVLHVIPLLPVFILQIFWFVALGALFLGHWPGGRGPAWAQVAAIPWPTPRQAQDAANEHPAGIPPEPGLEAGPAAKQSNPRKSKKRKKRR